MEVLDTLAIICAPCFVAALPLICVLCFYVGGECV